jgi:hypothetical protein
MQKLTAILLTALALAFLTFGIGAPEAQAGSAYCKSLYDICLARCAETQRCFPRCQARYRRCITPAPHLGELF